METKIIALQNQAINAALSQNWDEAIHINLEILSLDDRNIDAYLSTGYAYMQTNNYTNAQKYYKKALELHPGNPIAQCNLDKISILKTSKDTSSIKPCPKNIASIDKFIAVMGKTKIVELVKIGQSKIIVHLQIGEQVYYKERKRRLEVRNQNNEYIGALPDDLSKRLLFFIENKSNYAIYIKSALKNCVEVFIEEIQKGNKVKHLVSFPENIQDDFSTIMKDQDTEDEDTTEGSDDSQILESDSTSSDDQIQDDDTEEDDLNSESMIENESLNSLQESELESDSEDDDE